MTDRGCATAWPRLKGNDFDRNRHEQQFKESLVRRPEEPGLFAKGLGVVAGAALIVLGVMFSVVLLAVLVVAGLVAWGYVWWKTRELRKAMRERPPGGQVIEGEVVIVEEYDAAHRTTLPPDQEK